MAIGATPHHIDRVETPTAVPATGATDFNLERSSDQLMNAYTTGVQSRYP